MSGEYAHRIDSWPLAGSDSVGFAIDVRLVKSSGVSVEDNVWPYALPDTVVMQVDSFAVLPSPGL